MPLRVAIFGFGKVGRNVFRAIYPRRDMEIVAINDVADPEAMRYLMSFDSLKGRFPEPLLVHDGCLFAKGQRIPIVTEREPEKVPWFEYGVDVVVDASGSYRTRAELQKHLDRGADRVVLTTPPRDEIDAIYVRSVAEEPLRREARIVSCGSSTFNCTALMLKVLDRAFGVSSAYFTSVHTYTNEQNLIDVPSAVDLRLSRAAVENIVPVSSWTAKAIPRFFPRLEGRFGGGKLNVPVPDVSCVDLVTILDGPVDPRTVNEVFRSASMSTHKGQLDYTEEPIVSTDVKGSPMTCTFDAQTTMVVQGSMVKTLGWYDQAGSYAQRVVDLLEEMAPKGQL